MVYFYINYYFIEKYLLALGLLVLLSALLLFFGDLLVFSCGFLVLLIAFSSATSRH